VLIAFDYNRLTSSYRTILEDTPCHLNDGLTTIHFPDIHISFFRLLLDFLYSGQTYVPVHELEQLQDLLALLQIKPNIWRSGDSKKDIVNSKSCIKFYFWHTRLESTSRFGRSIGLSNEFQESAPST
jgi:BTB/POZ domain